MAGLGERVVVAALEGWSDAGHAATDAVAMLREQGDDADVFRLDPEPFFDYQYARPRIVTDADGRRLLRWPEITLSRPASDGLWLLTGEEPARAWQALIGELLDAMRDEGVTGLVTLGSLAADVPHTRPISVSAGTDDDRLRTELGVERNTYTGSVGLLGALSLNAAAVGIPTVGLWASVPHYVAGNSPSPKATLALLDRLESLVGHPVPHGDLAERAARWEASIDVAAAEDDQMSEYIRDLEHTRDTWDSPEASGEALAQEFQRYLRRRGDGRDPRG